MKEFVLEKLYAMLPWAQDPSCQAVDWMAMRPAGNGQLEPADTLDPKATHYCAIGKLMALNGVALYAKGIVQVPVFREATQALIRAARSLLTPEALLDYKDRSPITTLNDQHPELRLEMVKRAIIDVESREG